MTSLPSPLDRLRSMEALFRSKVKGQERALAEVAAQVRIGECGLATPERPKRSFLLIGPTGVGKTETARCLALALYGHRDPIRFDMSEFSNDDSIRNFIGSESGSLGRLGDALTAHPRGGVLLVDEVEKASPKVMDVFLQILDAGRVTCGRGETFDLSPFYVLLTSNLGAADILRAKHLNFTQIERHALAEVARHFRPEFLGRINSKLVYNKLSYETQLEIADMNMADELRFLGERGHRIEFDPEVRGFLIGVGFDKYLGARPLRDAIERHVRAPISAYLVETGHGCAVGRMDVDPARKHLNFVPA